MTSFLAESSAPPVSPLPSSAEVEARAGTLPAGVPGSSASSLRPISSLLDGAFDLYRSRFSALTATVGVYTLPALAIQIGLYNAWLRPLFASLEALPEAARIVPSLLGFCGLLLTGVPEAGVPGLLGVAALAFAAGPLARQATGLLYPGRQISVAPGLLRLGLRVLTVWLLTIAAFAAVYAVCGVLLSIWFGMMLVWLTPLLGNEGVSALFLLVLGGPYLLGAAVVARAGLLAAPIAAVEGVPLGTVLSRNGALTGRGLFWRVGAIAAGLPLLVYGLQWLTLMALAVAQEAAPLPGWSRDAIMSGLTALVGLIAHTYGLIALTVLYHDARLRREGTDLRELAEHVLGPRGGKR